MNHKKPATKVTTRGGDSRLRAADVLHKSNVTKSITNVGRDNVNWGVQKYITPRNHKAPCECNVYEEGEFHQKV